AGLAGLCFTTHYEPDPARADRERVRVNGRLLPVSSDWVGRYRQAIAEARLAYPELVVLAGVEIGFEPGLEGLTREFLVRHRFDFVIGSVHSIEHVALSSGSEQAEFAEWARRLTPEEVMARYLERVAAAARSGLFDTLGHFDIYRKYAVKLLGTGLLPAVESRLPGAIEAIAASRTALEINTSAFRRGDSEPYPAEAILRKALEVGVRRFTIGSDAHRPADVGAGFDRVRVLLQKLGVRDSQVRTP
ncbi:MAG TPA: histidinol-phosphatase HisJ family protein, partial [candidate division WOR-3 bacterium]|nr:histidinol-phosphatase HisJ family protein [candidate division WOR-3 bacterium]